MRVLLQRVRSASVTVDSKKVSSINHGLLLLVGISEDDTEEKLEWMVNKVSGLRIFEDSDGKFNLSVEDTGGEILVVSQFTLYGDARKGKRPSFSHAARPDIAEPLCKKFAQKLREKGINVGEGIFGAMMDVELINDGPVTLMIEK